jgi:DNA-directed RNA polymerase specialized sigma24 family protein
MGFRENLKRVATDPAIRRLAEWRAGCHQLAEDALQETYWNVVRTSDPEHIQDLGAFFRTALIREIHHQRAHWTAIPVEDITPTVDQGRPSSIRNPRACVEHDAELLLLAERLIGRLDREQFVAAIPGRSPDPARYRTAIIATARAILLLLLQGYVVSDDWNALLKRGYSGWFAEAGLASNSIDQRLSRARRDVQSLLQMVLPRHELG